MRKTGIAIAVTLLAVIGLLWGLDSLARIHDGSTVPAAAPAPTESPASCADASPPCPPINSTTDLFNQEAHPDAGWIIDPAPSAQPAISATQALADAWAADGIEAENADLEYGLLRAGGTIKSDTPIWLVRFNGVCVPVGGPAGATNLPTCAGTRWNVLVNADNGAYIASFSDA